MRNLQNFQSPLLYGRLLLSGLGVMGLLQIGNSGHAGETGGPSQDETSVHSSQASRQNPAASQNAPTQNQTVIPKRSNSPTDVQLGEQILSVIETSLDKKHKIKDDTFMHWPGGFSIKMTLDLATEQSFPADHLLKSDPKANPGLSVLVSEIIDFDRGLLKMSGKGNVDIELNSPDGKQILLSKMKLPQNSAESLSPRSSISSSISIDATKEEATPDTEKPLKSRRETNANALVQSAIDLVVEAINARNPFEVTLHYHTQEDFKILIEVKSTEIREKDQLHLSLPYKAEVPTTDQLLGELNALVQAGKQIKGKGTIRVRIERSVHNVSDKITSFLE